MGAARELAAPRLARPSRLPLEALGLGLAVAVGSGVALWAVGQVVYVWILCNTLTGAGIGWALGFAPRRAGFAHVPALLAAAVALCALPYLVMRYCIYLQALPSLEADGYAGGFFPVLVALIENRAVFGAELGLVPNLLVLGAEVGLSVYTAYGSLQRSLTAARIDRVPGEVLGFVVDGLGHGWEVAEVRNQLSRRGWSRLEDQELAIGSAFEVIAAMQAQAEAR